MSEMGQRANFGHLYEAVFALIREGRYRPGDRIGVKDLATRLKVSPTPLREVLSRLVGREIVEERRAEGYYLTRFDARDVADLYRLHLSCLELAFRTRPPWQRHDAADTDVWDLFDRYVAATGDRMLSSMQQFLADRLIVLRRCEAAHFTGSSEDLRLRTAILAGDAIDDVRRSVRSFHRLRCKAAQEISLLLNRT